MERFCLISLSIVIFLFIGLVSKAQKTWFKIAMGSENTLAIKTNGTLWGWGRNEFGQLGTGDTMPHSIPVQIGIENNWANIIVGGAHSIALKNDSTLWGWGNNELGQLGNGNVNDLHIPSQTGTEKWIKIATGSGHTAAIKADSSLWAWGTNFNGELGLNPSTTYYSSIPSPLGGTDKWINVTGAQNRTMAFRIDHTIWGWGWNFDGELGNGSTVDEYNATQAGSAKDWKFIASGVWSTLAIKENGSLWYWGWNRYGEAGIGNRVTQLVPIQIGTDTNWLDVSVYQSVLAVKSDGSFWGWGQNTYGELGLGNNTRQDVPVKISYLTNISGIYAGPGESAILNSDSDNVCMAGHNHYSQLGDGTALDRDKFQCGLAPNVLAINFLNITGYETNNLATISWKIATEKNSLRYEVEKSFNGTLFTKVAIINATVNPTSYAWIDVNAKPGNNFYRVRVVDQAGYEIISNTIRIKIGIKQKVSIYQNPSSGAYINLKFDNLPIGTYSVFLFNAIGKQQFVKIVRHSEASSFHTIKLLNALSKGAYFLRVKAQGNAYCLQVIVN